MEEARRLSHPFNTIPSTNTELHGTTWMDISLLIDIATHKKTIGSHCNTAQNGQAFS